MESLKIYKTMDYDMFNTLGGNRNINLKNANKIIASMKKRFIINPIIVNEKYEIIDGQHRHYACKELGIAIYYIIQPGLTLTDCHLMNCNSKNWTAEDFLNGYCELGNKNYLILKDFIEKNTHLSMGICETLLGGNSNIGNILHTKFKEGTYEVKDVKRAQEIADMLKDFEKYPPYGQKIFFTALIKMMNDSRYDHKRMLSKLSYQTSKLQKEVNVFSYLQSLNDIYNYKTRIADRVIFK